MAAQKVAMLQQNLEGCVAMLRAAEDERDQLRTQLAEAAADHGAAEARWAEAIDSFEEQVSAREQADEVR